MHTHPWRTSILLQVVCISWKEDMYREEEDKQERRSWMAPLKGFVGLNDTVLRWQGKWSLSESKHYISLCETTKSSLSAFAKRKIHVSYGLYLLIFTGYRRVLQAVECLINIILFANGSAIGEWYFLLNVQARFNKSVVCSFTFHCVGWDVSRAPSAGAGKQFRDAEVNESAGCVNSFCLCWLPLYSRKVPNTKGLHCVK